MALKLMLVETDEGLFRAIKEWVQALSVEVLALTETHEAIKRIQKERFDGFLVEGRLPPPDCFDLARAVRTGTSSRSAPIALLTEPEDLDTMRRAFAQGISVFLFKPVTQERLTALIRVMRGPMLAEKRRRARLPVRVPVACIQGGNRFNGTSVNLGEGGMLLDLPRKAELGGPIEMEFQVPGSENAVQARGRVIRNEPPSRSAIAFDNVPAEGIEAIRQFIRGTVKE